MNFRAKKSIIQLKVENARGILKEGLGNYIGSVPEWLPEYDKIVEWMTDNKRKGLLAVGDCGRGKSVICFDILPDVFSLLGIEFFKIEAYSLHKYMDGILDTDVLIVDDIGTEGVYSDFGTKRDLVSEVIDGAEKKSVLLILTTNLNSVELEKRYGRRVTDRLKAMVEPVVFKGDSLRGKPQKPFFYSYNIPFETEEDADKFDRIQSSIRDGWRSGKYKPSSRAVEIEMTRCSPVKLIGDMIYLYDPIL